MLGYQGAHLQWLCTHQTHVPREVCGWPNNGLSHLDLIQQWWQHPEAVAQPHILLRRTEACNAQLLPRAHGWRTLLALACSCSCCCPTAAAAVCSQQLQDGRHDVIVRLSLVLHIVLLIQSDVR